MRTGLTLFAVLFAVLLPAQVTVCLGEEGHVAIELANAPCCPDENGDCSDCTDREGSELLGPKTVGPASAALAAAVTISAPRLPAAADRPRPGEIEPPPVSRVGIVVLRI